MYESINDEILGFVSEQTEHLEIDEFVDCLEELIGELQARLDAARADLG